ncbi:CHASE3 domain-containing protein [Isosphaeraceae bacterium EP7]
MLDDLSLLKKVLLVIAIPVAFQLVFLAVLFQTQASGRSAQHWAIHTKNVIAKAEILSRLYMQAQNSVRGYVLTGERAFTQEFDATLLLAGAELAQLRGLVADNPKQAARVELVAVRGRILTDWLSEKVALVSEGRSAEAVAHVRELAGKQAFDSVRSIVEEFLTEEERLDGLRRIEVDRTWAWQRWFFSSAALLTLCLVAGLALVVNRTFSGRIGMLMENVRWLSEGKPLHKPLTGRDEIGALDAAFHRMARTLGEREQENEMFIYSVSHDLRSPLVNLQGFGKELVYSCNDLKTAIGLLDVPEEDRRRFSAILDDDIQGSVHYITVAVRRLSAIIDALLRLSRAGRVEYLSQVVDVQMAATHVADALRGTAEEKGARIEIGTLHPAWGDQTAIEQIFANLINNAVKYLDPSRPGVIDVGELDEPETPLRAEASRMRTYFVRDNGLGILADHMPKLFQAFQRLHPGVAEGEGIGLAIVRRVVERHGGKIWVESKAGEGSTFYVRIPSEATGAAPEEARKRPIYGQGSLSR